MKKVIFTAIAMIAFSGASMANTEEVKKVTENDDLDVRANCMQEAMAVYNELSSAGIEESECQYEANAAYGDCIGG